MSGKVLFVDDDANVLASYARQLRKRFDFVTAQGGAQALQLVKSQGPFAVVVSDMKMPAMNGVELLRQLSENAPETVRMMLTGNADQQTAMDAVNDGQIFRFLTKPCPPETLAAAIAAGQEQYRLLTAEKTLLEQTLAGSIKVLVDVLALVDPESFSRTKQLREVTRSLAEQLGQTALWQLDMAAMLSPIGRITLPNELTAKLRAESRLDEDERALVARVPEISRDLIANIPRLTEVSEIIYFQDKGYDGSGFPDLAIAADDIPIAARILRVAKDLTAACAGQPPYGPAIAGLEASAQLYDPKVLAAARSRYLGEGDDEGEAKEAVERVPLPFARLRAGDKLMSNIVTEGDQLILAAGIELNQALLEKLRNLHKVRRLREPIYVARPMVAEPARDQTAEERPAEDQTAQDQPANLQPAKAASA